MATQGRWKLLACTVVLSGAVLGGVLVYGRLGRIAQEEIR